MRLAIPFALVLFTLPLHSQGAGFCSPFRT